MIFVSLNFYIWATTLVDTDTTEGFQFTVEDAEFNKNGRGEYFSSLDDLVILTHTGGVLMNWPDYEFYFTVQGSGTGGYLYIDRIGGEDYSEEINCATNVGGTLVLRSFQDEKFKSGDVGRLVISKWETERYRKESIRLI